MSFFYSNLGFWSKLLIMELDSGSLGYSTRISSNQSGMTTVVAYALTSSSFRDSASTTTLSSFFVYYFHIKGGKFLHPLLLFCGQCFLS
jgi:hypothetical protein